MPLSSPYRTPTFTPPTPPPRRPWWAHVRAALLVLALSISTLLRRIPRRAHTLATLAALLVLASPLLALVQCHPQLPPVSGCAPLTTSCIGDTPQVCSTSQRWEPAGDTTCGVLGGVCVEDTRGAHCARVRDGGADVADAVGADL